MCKFACINNCNPATDTDHSNWSIHTDFDSPDPPQCLHRSPEVLSRPANFGSKWGIASWLGRRPSRQWIHSLKYFWRKIRRDSEKWNLGDLECLFQEPWYEVFLQGFLYHSIQSLIQNQPRFVPYWLIIQISHLLVLHGSGFKQILIHHT